MRLGLCLQKNSKNIRGTGIPVQTTRPKTGSIGSILAETS